MTDLNKNKPKPSNSLAERELDKAEKQFQEFDQSVKQMTMDRMNEAPAPEKKEETRISQAEIQNSKEIYLKPHRSIGAKEKFNEDYRKDYEFSKEYVRFIAKNNEIIGEDIDMWTKPFAGMACEWWKIPVNKPIWAPRYVAEQVKRKKYHRLVMQDRATETTGVGTMYGTLAADTTIQRLDAEPVSNSKSIFMGASNF